MNTADSAEEIVKIYLEGVEMSLRVTGTAAKNIAMMLIAMSKEKQATRGKTRLTNMLKTNKPLKIFTISADELKKFSQEAKKYGILYCALANKNNSKIDGMVDIMIKEEDAGKMNRIAERFNFKDVTIIKEEMEKAKEEKLAKLAEKSEDEIFIDEIMPTSKEEEKQIPSNDKQKTEKKNQLENSLNTKQKDKQTEKPSVLKELDYIKRQLEKNQTNGKHYKEKENTKEKYKNKHKGKRYKEPKHYKEKVKKSKERGK